MSLCFVTHWVFNFVIGQAFLPVVEAVGGPTVFLGFSAVCVAAAFFVQTQVLETKGKTLDMIQRRDSRLEQRLGARYLMQITAMRGCANNTRADMEGARARLTSLVDYLYLLSLTES